MCLEISGHLGADDLSAITAGLELGTVHELMCHPGRLDQSEIPTLACCVTTTGSASSRRSPTLP
jgi:hypothetical protein